MKVDVMPLRDQRDRVEKELLQSRARYRALAGNLTYGICHCGLDGRFLEVNEVMMMLGYEATLELKMDGESLRRFECRIERMAQDLGVRMITLSMQPAVYGGATL